jgi:hypothetical protein
VFEQLLRHAEEIFGCYPVLVSPLHVSTPGVCFCLFVSPFAGVNVVVSGTALVLGGGQVATLRGIPITQDTYPKHWQPLSACGM